MRNEPEKELCLNTLLGVLGLPRLVWPTTGLLLSLDMLPCCGEVKPSGSRQESLSCSEEQSASPEVREDTLIRSQFTSCGRGGRTQNEIKNHCGGSVSGDITTGKMLSFQPVLMRSGRRDENRSGWPSPPRPFLLI